MWKLIVLSSLLTIGCGKSRPDAAPVQAASTSPGPANTLDAGWPSDALPDVTARANPAGMSPAAAAPTLVDAGIPPGDGSSGGPF